MGIPWRGIPDEIEGVTPPTHTHTRVVSSLFSKSVLNWRGCLQYDILEIRNFVGFFLIIVGLIKTMAVSNIKYSEHLKRVGNSRFLCQFL